ncbi:FkbM family methyltransferase [Branchiibius sp. NY16-3462-2]|uniref:FkbM family methyltransferase n=1 Tax=Branchiibius sp. NY16-3462-2 TaxID=1807500 RepID=UPI0007933BA1|nr:FkbM family methyltransferase [Branchiibius sp. NY16-3462-2]KYH43071.1 hypothetical protein AZH51_06375 [Branchiibius sp. NY16-3462-2]
MKSPVGTIKKRLADGITAGIGRRGYSLVGPRFHEEQEIDLRSLLARPIEERKGSFTVLQIGANDGVENDPIHQAVVERQWSLYAVEPVPEVYEALVRTYAGNPRVHPINGAVGAHNGTATMYRVRQDGAVDGLPFDQFSSFSREVVKRRWHYIPDVRDRIEEVTVPTLTLAELIERYAIPEIDLLQIDVEGFDFEIVRMAFALGLTPAILSFEWVNLSQADMWECRNALIDHGYRWMLCKGDVIASRAAIPLPSWVTADQSH